MAGKPISASFFLRSPVDSAMIIGKDNFERLELSANLPAKVAIHQEKPALDVPVHWHTGCEIIYPRNLSLEILVDGTRSVVRPGSFILISPYALHAVKPERIAGRQDVLSISFDGENLARLYPTAARSRIGLGAPGAGDESVGLMLDLLERMYELVSVATEGNVDVFEACSILYQMLHLMFRDFLIEKDANTTSASFESRSKMAAMLSFMQEHFREDISSTDVAENFGYSASTSRECSRPTPASRSRGISRACASRRRPTFCSARLR